MGCFDWWMKTLGQNLKKVEKPRDVKIVLETLGFQTPGSIDPAFISSSIQRQVIPPRVIRRFTDCYAVSVSGKIFQLHI